MTRHQRHERIVHFRFDERHQPSAAVQLDHEFAVVRIQLLYAGRDVLPQEQSGRRFHVRLVGRRVGRGSGQRKRVCRFDEHVVVVQHGRRRLLDRRCLDGVPAVVRIMMTVVVVPHEVAILDRMIMVMMAREGRLVAVVVVHVVVEEFVHL